MRWLTLLLMIAATAGLGCDDKSSGPPVPPKPVKEIEEPKPPTTQELETGKRKIISLAPLPMTIQAPESWSVQTLQAVSMVTLLQGWTPGGEVKIQLSQQPQTTIERIESLAEGARNEMKTDGRTRVADLRTKGKIKVFERQRLGQATSLPSLDVDGNPGKPMPPLYQWTLTYYVPADEKNYKAYSLNFIGLNVEQYKADHAFLEKILDTIQVTAP
ncbi:MAG TPA: hypothetical protein VIL86_21020 [Tepidisphaeraceae bacterium]|jgi:hypothetical protein